MATRFPLSFVAETDSIERRARLCSPSPGGRGGGQAPPIRVIPGSRLSQRLTGSLSPPREVQRSGLGCSREEAFSPRGCGERRGGCTLRGRDGAIFLSRSLEAALRQLRRVVRARPSVPSSAGGFLSRVLTPAAAPGRRVGRGPGRALLCLRETPVWGSGLRQPPAFPRLFFLRPLELLLGIALHIYVAVCSRPSPRNGIAPIPPFPVVPRRLRVSVAW